MKTGVISLFVHILSQHPLASRVIEQAVASDPELRDAVRPFTDTPPVRDKSSRHVLVLDTLTVENWHEVLRQWLSSGAYAVALVSAASGQSAHFRSISLGVHGIVDLTSDLSTNLPRAIHAAANGQSWISRAALLEYVRETNSLLAELSNPRPRFTCREDQTLQLLLYGQTNKEIASTLNISERTVKFHVSNILQKFGVANRRQLIRSQLTARSMAPKLTYAAQGASHAGKSPEQLLRKTADPLAS
jgi:two-component system, NarL family, nitrate/nitrite response regulator NarL